MKNPPQSAEQLKVLLNSGARFNFFKAETQIRSNGLDYDIQLASDEMLSELVNNRFQKEINSSSPSIASYLKSMHQELEHRLSIKMEEFRDKLVSEPIKKFFNEEFKQQLKQDIGRNKDILYRPFEKAFIEYFSHTFKLSGGDVHNLGLRNIIAGYFPSPDVHSKGARHMRTRMHNSHFERSITELVKAYDDGKKDIERTLKGKFKSGDRAEFAWCKVIENYFGVDFGVIQRVAIHDCDERLPEYDVVVYKKDKSHKIDAELRCVELEDVVAVFEVKRTLNKRHVEFKSDEAVGIFEKSCEDLKKASMPINRTDSDELSPYQSLRGRVFFGVICLDIEESAIKLLNSTENHIFKSRLVDSYYPDYEVDIIFCPNKFLYVKEVFLIPESLRIGVRNKTQQNISDVDESLSTFGFFIASIRRFLVAQGHIPSSLKREYLKKYRYFELLPVDCVRLSITTFERQPPSYLVELNRYLSSKVPNEHTNMHIDKRKPLLLFKQWSPEAVHDIANHVKEQLYRIAKMELSLKYNPLPEGVEIKKESFDKYFKTLFAD